MFKYFLISFRLVVLYLKLLPAKSGVIIISTEFILKLLTMYSFKDSETTVIFLNFLNI